MCKGRALCRFAAGIVFERGERYGLSLDMEWLRYDRDGLFVFISGFASHSYGTRTYDYTTLHFHHRGGS
jgi:hypothetical protein